MSQPAPGRRAVRPDRARTVSLGLALAVGAPLVTLVALLVQAPAHDQDTVTTRSPEAARLGSASVACPAPLGSAESVTVLSGADGGAGGRVTLVSAAAGARPAKVSVRGGGYDVTPTADAPVVVRGSGGLAPGLVAARFGPPGVVASGECVAPVGERWFVGVGAGGDHTSLLELVNPDTGPAVADVSLWSTDGPMEEVESRGLTIPGGRSTHLDLERVAPHRDDLAVRVSVTRGRVAATFLDRLSFDGGRPSPDWAATTAAPTTSQILPGLASRAEDRQLVLVNPGADEGRVTVQVVGRRSTFRPAGLDEIRVPAGTVVVTDLTRVLARAVASDDASLLVTSTVPVAAGLHEVVGGDLVQHAGAIGESGSAAALLPGSRDTVLLVVPTELTGSVTVEFLGPRPGRERAVVQARTAAAIEVPAGAVGVVVRSKVPYVAAVRSLSDRGGTVVPLRPLVLEQLLPSVVPAWPH